MNYSDAINYVVNNLNGIVVNMGDKNISRINISHDKINSVMFFNHFPLASNVTFNWKN